MKKVFKRLLSTTLVLTMLLTMVTVPASAAVEKIILAEISPANVSISDVVTTNDASYSDGSKLGSANLTSAGLIDATAADLSKIEDEFKVEDGYIWAYIHNQGSVTEDRTISRHFAPVNDGETLNLSTTVRFNYTTPNDSTHYTGGSVELSGASGNLSLIQFGNSPWRQTVRFLNDGGANYFAQNHVNTDVTTTGQFRWIYDPKQLNGNDLFYSDGTDNGTYIYAHPNKDGDANALDGDITLTLTATPNQADDSKYDLTLVTAGLRIDAVSTRTVDKSLILGLSDFHMVTSRSTTEHQVAVEKVIGLKSLEIHTDREKIVNDAKIVDVCVGDAELVKSDILLNGQKQNMSVSDFVLKTDAEYTSGNKWGVDSESDKSNGWSDSDGFLWASLHGHTSEHKEHTVSKKFNAVEKGETLKLSTSFKLNFAGTSPWHYSGIQLRSDSGDVLRLFDLKTNDYYAYMHLLSTFTSNDYTESYPDTTVTTTGWSSENGEKKTLSGNNAFAGDERGLPCFNLQAIQEGGYGRPFDGILTITLMAKPDEYDETKYNLTQILEGKNLYLESTSAIEASKITALNSFNIVVSNASDTTNDAKVIGVKDIRITQLNTSGNNVLAKINPAGANISDVVTTSDSAYLDGSKLGSANLTSAGLIDTTDADLSKINDEFKVEDGYIWAYIHNQGSVTEDRTISKHFASVNDGETLNLSTTVRFNYTTTNDSTHYTGASVELSGAGGNLPLIQFGNCPWRQTVRFLSDGGANYFAQAHTNTDVTTTGQFRWIYDPKQLNGNDLFYSDGTDNGTYIYAHPNKDGDANALDGDITLTLTAKPNQTDNSKYDLTLVTTGPRIDAVSTRTVDKSLILGLSDFHIVTSRSTNAHQVAVEKTIGLKDLTIKSSGNDEVASELVAGKNKVYIPVMIPDDAKADFAIVAAVCDKATGAQKEFFTDKITNVQTSRNIELEFEVTSPLSEYVSVYVFDTFDNLAPYTKSAHLEN